MRRPSSQPSRLAGGSPAPVVVAIDGPSASGKSTNARLVARALGYAHVDTGAMYRTFAWHCLQSGVDPNDDAATAKLGRSWRPALVCVDGQVRVLQDGYHPHREIRTREVTLAASAVAANPAVRERLTRLQRQCLQFGNLVMEGRDIGTHVFPESPHKFYLEASLEERARRRAAEGRGDDLAQRDRQDSQRASAPLMVGLGVARIDTGGRSPEETSRMILEEIARKRGASPTNR